MRYLTPLLCGTVAGVLFSFQSSAQAPTLKVDLNTADRRPAEVNQPGYTPCPIKTRKADTLKSNGLTIIFTNKGGNGTTLKSGFYKTAVQAPYYARLVGDGLVATGDNAGAKLEMRISGLPAGQNTLLTFHNGIDGKPEPNQINIYVDGKLAVENLEPTNRVKENTEAKTAYLNLNATAKKDVVILFDATQAGKQVIINGFEINTQDPAKMAKLPSPLNRDEHVDADAGKLTLNWTPAQGTVSNQVYFGIDSVAVSNATSSSPLLKGNLKSAGLAVDNLYSMSAYYWRVDEVDASGKTTKGNVWYFKPRQLAFNDAEGYGRFARGGRGGKVVEVTNLNDDGPGSLREAVNKNIGPRTIVFTVAGVIQLKSRLVITEPNVTIAGQTAPGKGICISKAPLGITADDAIIRFLRVRIGAGTTYDGMGITGADNSIVDHCSISWSIDESFSSRGAHNITLQRTLISEALNVAGHDHYEKGKAHGFAASIGGDVGSFHHNLLAHCAGRNFSLAGGVDGDGNYLGRMDIRNNVIYNWDHRTTDGGARQVNFVGNYYKPGASTTYMYALNAQHEGYGGGRQQYFFDGNVMPGRFNESNQSAGRTQSGKVTYQTYLDEQFFEPYVRTQSAGDAYKSVLSDVGCNEPVFDDHDIRIINETINGTYTYKGSKTGKAGLIDSEKDAGGLENYPEEHRTPTFDSDHDGLPEWWEKLHSLNVHSAAGDFSDANADADHNGYTNLDDYLEWLANPHYIADLDKPLDIDVKQLSRGFTEKPVYEISDVVNGAVTVQKNGIARFTPTKIGLASFKLTVTDGSGSLFVRNINILAGVYISDK